MFGMVFDAVLEAMDGVLFIGGKLFCNTGDGIGEDVAVMKVLHAGRPAEVEPEAMHQFDFIGLDGGGVWADVEAEGFSVGLDDVEGELSLGLREGFPCLADVVGLFCGGELGGEAGDDGGGVERVGGLNECGEDVAGRDDEQGDVFAKAFCDGDGLGKEHLLVLAEELFGGVDVLGASDAHHASGEDDEVLIFGIGVGEGPFEREGGG